MVDYSTLETIDLFEYLCIRIKQIGIRSVHGVPGDFNLVALDYVEKCGLRWVGNCNELNAGYAADGYARINGISALMTVMGVGELSALNAIAGSFAEYVPVIHIVGKPSQHAQREQLCLHHTLGDGDFTSFEEMSRRVSCMTASIDCPQTAPALIDEAIRACWVQSRPVFIFIASDMVRVPIARHLLSSCPPLGRTMPHDDILQHGRLVDTVINEIQQATNPVILVGGYGTLHGAKRELDGFLSSVELPILAAASGLGIVDANLPNYTGLYVGSCSSPNVLELMHSVDLVIGIGNIQSDLSTSGFSGNVDHTRLIEIERTKAKVKGHSFTNVHINNLLIALTAKLGIKPVAGSACVDYTHQHKPLITILPKTDINVPTPRRSTEKSAQNQFLDYFRDSARFFRALWLIRPQMPRHVSEAHNPITHDWFWGRLGEWLREGDIILTETGTASFGIWNTTLPLDAIFLAQYLWSSIGYTIGACQGAALAARDSSNPQRRTILFIGDGSLQCGCQELSTIVRHSLTPIIFVICNSGYTVERLIHGERQVYNDIQPWVHRLLPAAFGAAPGAYQTHRVETREHLQALWSCESFSDCSVLQLIELCVAQNNAPSNLVALARSLKQRNA
ncbi:pyruvate decarboxylase [Penicillium samsonianum]|uniref:pyruvate decarboxylase n=1 Tax=Penicillium samsonianum TaxID=1882272 RepID=UPI00254947A8|nr:pyruvate decarboxylase [Penicillium samsonianum]KAJ6118245.1 pyruvate decarboxylase [Penicillium samsonianum]